MTTDHCYHVLQTKKPVGLTRLLWSTRRISRGAPCAPSA